MSSLVSAKVAAFYLSLIEFNDDSFKHVDPSPQKRFKTHHFDATLPDNTFTIKATKPFYDEFALINQLSTLHKKMPKEATSLFIIHSHQDCARDKEVQLVTVTQGLAITYKTIMNPKWQGLGGVYRNVSSVFLQPEVSLAMQSQLFAMLDVTRSDQKWMSEFELKDHQQQIIYDWQFNALPGGNSITVDRMMTLMKNVLNVVRLPWIKLILKDSGKACCFRVKFDSKTANQETIATTQDQGQLNWLHEATPQTWEAMGHYDKTPKIKIEKMELEFVTTWGLNPYTLLHELAHYIAFCLPLPTKLNKGQRRLSFKEYERMFAGHGLLFVSIYRHLLIKFALIDEAWLDASFSASQVKYLNIKEVTADAVEKIISDPETRIL